ncbi:MAG TPA: lactonase family protein, partial [Opitutaceae bacterium]|nr:lactonase family protein [Opitutaceae bacterium]
MTRRSFLQTATGLALAGPTLVSLRAQAPGARGPLMAYVGTYSSPAVDRAPGKVDLPPGNGRGIHLFRVDRRSGALSPAGVYEHPTSPSSLAINGAGTRMYSTNATDKFDGSDSGSVSAFAIDRFNGELTLLNTVAAGGMGPTYVSLHPAGQHALVANYAGGSVSVFPLLADGRLGPASDIKKSSGQVGPKRATNAPAGSFAFSGHDFPHSHMIQADPAGRFVLVADLGLDLIQVWKFDGRTGVLTPNDPASVALPPGDGARHFAFHPKRGWLYSLQEEGSTIVLFDYDATQGRLTARQTISSLPPGFAGSSFSSEIMVSADGRFVYAANRL